MVMVLCSVFNVHQFQCLLHFLLISKIKQTECDMHWPYLVGEEPSAHESLMNANQKSIDISVERNFQPTE